QTIRDLAVTRRHGARGRGRRLPAGLYLDTPFRRASGTPAAPPRHRRQGARVIPAGFAAGRYTVRRLLGEGSRKRVYLAHDARLDREVALAVIRTEGLDDAARARVRREAQAMARLGDHPHIVTVYDRSEERRVGKGWWRR